MTIEKLRSLQDLNELRFTENEEAAVLSLFEKMAQKEASLSALDTSETEPMVYVRPMTNILRNDERNQPFSRDDLLSGAPEHTDDSWQVPILVK